MNMSKKKYEYGLEGCESMNQRPGSVNEWLFLVVFLLHGFLYSYYLIK